MDVNLSYKIGLDHDIESIDRRQVVRALGDARRRLEDERGVGSNFMDPRADMLIQIVKDMKLDALEAVEVLGAELVCERILVKYIPDLPFAEHDAWMDAHRGSTIATLDVGRDLQ
jgi:hypothetical protein